MTTLQLPKDAVMDDDGKFLFEIPEESLSLQIIPRSSKVSCYVEEWKSDPILPPQQPFRIAELLEHILTFLSVSSFLRLSQTSRYFYRIRQSRAFFEKAMDLLPRKLREEMQVRSIELRHFRYSQLSSFFAFSSFESYISTFAPYHAFT